jgi:hypothetical protein
LYANTVPLFAFFVFTSLNKLIVEKTGCVCVTVVVLFGSSIFTIVVSFVISVVVSVFVFIVLFVVVCVAVFFSITTCSVELSTLLPD